MLFPPRKQGLTSDTVVCYLGGEISYVVSTKETGVSQ